MSRQSPEADKRLVQVLADPALITPRLRDLGPEDDEPETLTSWQARALVLAGLAVRTKP